MGYDQIYGQDLWKKGKISKHYVQTSLKLFSYFYLDLYFKNLRAVNKKDYYDSLDQSFNDQP